ncbi:uncharacterized protein LOC119401803 [Rhipicephalus sanguineus]|uniref:uncharacterized protein LOC119401803 n=1 Tax=Rhipicephalus sanguineus TaxID=34632 RepID=UPI0020C26572|nr:uncharacterized protein LOC119401803 [Rhipicephalus sanguineus]
MSTSPNVRQRYENIDRNTTRGGNRQSGTKWSATNVGILPSPTGLASRDAEVQVPSAAFNTLGQNVRLPGEQEILLRPSATLRNIPANDQKANLGRALLEAIWRATQGRAERQSGHATAQLPHTPQEESSQADTLVTFLNKAYQGTSATPKAYQSHVRTSNPNSPTVRKKHDFTLPQQAPLTAHQQRNLPLPSLIPILDPYNLVMLSTSPYQTSPSAPNSPSFLFPEQINEVRHPHITNLVAPPEMQQRSFDLLQGTSSAVQDFRQQLNPDLGGTTVDQNNIPGMADAGLYTSSTLLRTLGIRPAVQSNQFGQQPMPAYSAASHGYMMANTAPQMIRAYVPLPQTVTQGAATHITSQTQPN